VIFLTCAWRTGAGRQPLATGFSMYCGDGSVPHRKNGSGPTVAVSRSRRRFACPCGSQLGCLSRPFRPQHRRRGYRSGRFECSAFAIDWMSLAPMDGCSGDSKATPTSIVWRSGPGGDGRISDLKTAPDNVGSNEQSAVHHLDNIPENYLILRSRPRALRPTCDTCSGAFCEGRQSEGRPMWRVSQLGQFRCPHLHFHLRMQLALGAEGLPYELETFTRQRVAEPAAWTVPGMAPKTQWRRPCSSTKFLSTTRSRFPLKS